MQGNKKENVVEIVALNAASAFMSICRRQGLSDKEIVANVNGIFSRKETFNNTGWYKTALK